MSWLELKIPPILLMLISAGGIYYFKQAHFAEAGWGIQLGAAGLILLAGAYLLLRAVQRFARAKTTVNPHTPSQTSELVIDGEYRWTRNPMYLGMLLVLISVLIYMPSLTGGVITATFLVFITRFQIMPEERMLEAQFGEDYRVYKKRVRRWV